MTFEGPVMRAILKNAKACAIVLLRNPGLTTLGVLSLVLAIGANASVFNVVNAMTLLPQCAQAPGRLVTVLTNHPRPAFDTCGSVAISESEPDREDVSIGSETSMLSTGPAESESSLVAGDQKLAQSRAALPRTAGARCGQSNPVSSDFTAAGWGGYALHLQ